MHITYLKTKFGYHIETDIIFCCEEMKGFYDFSHRSQFGIALGHHSGKVRFFGRFNMVVDDYQHVDIHNCPFCGKKIESLER